MATTEAPNAADLQKAANDAISSASAFGEDAKGAAGSKREALLKHALALKDQAKQVSDQSKAYLDKVVDKVGIYAQQATDKATTHIETLQTTAQSHLQELKGNFEKAVKAGQSSGTTAAPTTTTDTPTDKSFSPVTGHVNGGSAEANDAIKFPFNIVTWCTSVCGGKDGAPLTLAGRDFSVESLQTSLQSVQSSLESGVAAATEQAKAAAASAKEKAAAAVSEAQALGADAQQSVTEKAAVLSEAVDAEQKKLVEQGEAAKDAAAAEASAIQEEVAKLQTST